MGAAVAAIVTWPRLLRLGLRLALLRLLDWFFHRRWRLLLLTILLPLGKLRLAVAALTLAAFIGLVLIEHLIARGTPILLLLLLLLILLVVGLCCGQDAQIVLGMLIEILGHDIVARSLSIAAKLEILVGDRLCGAANFHLRAIALVDSIDRIAAASAATTPWMPPAAASTAALIVVLA